MQECDPQDRENVLPPIVRKRFIGALLAVVLLLAFRWAVARIHESEPRLLALPGGASIQITDVTYGTNHVSGPFIGRLALRMPQQVQRLLTRTFRGRLDAYELNTTGPSLMVWLDHVPASTTPGYLSAMVADSNGFTAGKNTSMYGGTMTRIVFEAFPRRDAQLALTFFHHSTNGSVTNCGSLMFNNPAQGTFPQWTPEPLPATRCSGDLEVTLNGFSTGHDQNITQTTLPDGNTALSFGTNRLSDRNNSVLTARVRSLSDTGQVWWITSVKLSDASSNHITQSGMSWSTPKAGYLSFEPSLWPSEAAWKLQLELKRLQGFSPDELLTFHQVPLGSIDSTNAINWTTNHGNVSLTLKQFIRRAPAGNLRSLSEASFTMTGVSNGTRLDLISVRTDTGTNLNHGCWSGSDNERSYQYGNIPMDAKTADFTFAVQQSRQVEFVVKPEVGPFQAAYPSDP